MVKLPKTWSAQGPERCRRLRDDAQHQPRKRRAVSGRPFRELVGSASCGHLWTWTLNFMGLSKPPWCSPTAIIRWFPHDSGHDLVLDIRSCHRGLKVMWLPLSVTCFRPLRLGSATMDETSSTHGLVLHLWLVAGHTATRFGLGGSLTHLKLRRPGHGSPRPRCVNKPMIHWRSRVCIGVLTIPGRT